MVARTGGAGTERLATRLALSRGVTVIRTTNLFHGNGTRQLNVPPLEVSSNPVNIHTRLRGSG